MSKLTRVIFLMLFAFLSISANAAAFDRLVVFGDSLSDSGRVSDLSGGEIPRTPPYFYEPENDPKKKLNIGYFSNGPVWVDYLADALHIDMKSDDQFFTNAWGGAWASEDPEPFFTLKWEVENYLEHESDPETHHAYHATNPLYIIWIGNNDYIGGDRTKSKQGLMLDPEEATTRVVAAIKNAMITLYDDKNEHARNFLVMNLSDLGLTPDTIDRGAKAVQRLSDLAMLHNQKLAAMLATLQQERPEMKLITIDVMPYFNDLINNPTSHGLKYAWTACYDGDFGLQADNSAALLQSPKRMALRKGLKTPFFAANKEKENNWFVCLDPNEYVYWDHLHPTGAVHKLLAGYVIDAIKARGLV